MIMKMKTLRLAGLATFCAFSGWALAQEGNPQSPKSQEPRHKSAAQSDDKMNQSGDKSMNPSGDKSMKQSGDKSMKQGMMKDEMFAKKAAQGGMAEVKMGQLAAEKGSNEAVKKFGQRMVDDHTKANDELKDIASKENITLPTDLDAKDQAICDRLSKLSGEAFDKAYARDMVRDHQKDVAEFKREANSGKDDAIKGFASKTLPTLEDHLKEARQMLQSVSASTEKKGTRGSGDSQQR